MADETQQPALQEQSDPRSRQAVKIYIKDVSFETPNSPEIFLKEWQPNLELEIGNNFGVTNDGHHEAVLILTVTVKVNEVTAYLAEVHQAGIFSITGFDEDEIHRIYSIFCNRTLYPYACAALSDLVSKGGFPQLVLSPIDWIQVFEQRKSSKQAESADAENS